MGVDGCASAGAVSTVGEGVGGRSGAGAMAFFISSFQKKQKPPGSAPQPQPLYHTPSRGTGQASPGLTLLDGVENRSFTVFGYPSNMPALQPLTIKGFLFIVFMSDNIHYVKFHV